MPAPRIVYLYPRPVIEAALPRGEPVLAPEVSPDPDARRVGLRRAAHLAMACALGCVLLALIASLCVPQARASEPQPPPVDVPALLGQLDRIHEAVIPALVERCRIHAGGRCLHAMPRDSAR